MGGLWCKSSLIQLHFACRKFSSVCDAQVLMSRVCSQSAQGALCQRWLAQTGLQQGEQDSSRPKGGLLDLSQQQDEPRAQSTPKKILS